MKSGCHSVLGIGGLFIRDSRSLGKLIFTLSIGIGNRCFSVNPYFESQYSIPCTIQRSIEYGKWRIGDVIERSSPLFSGIAIEQWHKISYTR